MALAGYANNTPPLPGAVDNFEEIDDQMRDLIKKCWNKPPSRPTCDTIRKALAGMNILDTRSKITVGNQSGVSFLQDMGANLDPEIDYTRVYEILQKVRRNRWPNASA